MDNNIDPKTLNYFILMKAIHNELFQDMIILNNHELIQRKASIMRLQLKKDERKSPPPLLDSNCGPLEPKTSVLPISYHDSYLHCHFHIV